MRLVSQLTTLRNQSRDLPINERAECACQLAKQLEKTGNYELAAQALEEFWLEPTESPIVDGLNREMKARVMAQAGVVLGWLASENYVPVDQEPAKDLITRAVEMFEELGDDEKTAEARSDLSLCYWREGAFDEARIQLNTALELLKDANSDLKASFLVRAGLVEAMAGRTNRALQFYEESTPLIEQSSDLTLKGSFHSSRATLFTRMTDTENREDYLDRALIEYAAASLHFEQAEHHQFLASTENNLGYLHFSIGRYSDAHYHLDRARSVFLRQNATVKAAQVDDTRARTLLAEGRLREADRVIKGAVKALEKGGHQALLTEALTTHGTIAARMGSHARAMLLLQRAVVVAETAGDLEGAGRAHLTIVEELGTHTPLKQLAEIYKQAGELLEQSQNPATNKRLISCGRKVIDALLADDRNDTMALAEVGSWASFSLRKEIVKLEKILIERALRDAGGSVTKASKLLGFKHHQSLIGLINSRHRELLPRRSTVRRRRHHLFSEPKRSRTKQGPPPQEDQLRVLHVENSRPVAHFVKDLLSPSCYVQSYVSGLPALDMLKSDTPIDALIVDNDLPGVSGLELVLRARSMPHRRHLPIVMLTGDEVEKEAWRAGVDAFLPKAEAAERLAGTLERLSTKRNK